MRYVTITRYNYIASHHATICILRFTFSHLHLHLQSRFNCLIAFYNLHRHRVVDYALHCATLPYPTLTHIHYPTLHYLTLQFGFTFTFTLHYITFIALRYKTLQLQLHYIIYANTFAIS